MSLVTIKSSSKEGGHNESKIYRYFGGNNLGHDDFCMPAVSQDAAETEKKAKLESIIKVYIISCENKAALAGSRSKNLRHSAMLSHLKSTFCRHSKQELMHAMLKDGVEPKPYKVHHFLNARFLETIRAVAVAKK